MNLAQAVDRVEIVGIGGQLRVPRLTVERLPIALARGSLQYKY